LVGVITQVVDFSYFFLNALMTPKHHFLCNEKMHGVA